MDTKKPTSPFAKVQPRLPQFSLRTILLLTLLAAVASTMLVAALRSPFVANEIALMTGKPLLFQAEAIGRNCFFLLLCYSSTMLLALIVRVAASVNEWLRLRRQAVQQDQDLDPFLVIEYAFAGQCRPQKCSPRTL